MQESWFLRLDAPSGTQVPGVGPPCHSRFFQQLLVLLLMTPPPSAPLTFPQFTHTSELCDNALLHGDRRRPLKVISKVTELKVGPANAAAGAEANKNWWALSTNVEK